MQKSAKIYFYPQFVTPDMCAFTGGDIKMMLVGINLSFKLGRKSKEYLAGNRVQKL